MSDWDIIVPAGTTSLITNPGFEVGATTGYTFDGTNTGAISTAQSKFGFRSCLCTYGNDLDLARYAITLTAAAHTFSAWVYLGATWDGGAVRLNMENFAGGAVTTATTTTTTLETWVRLQITYTPVGGDLVGDLVVECASAPTAGRFIWIDAAQCEALSYSTTYCDGDQAGCEWNGTAHASTSTRSAQSRAGGRVFDLRDEYGFQMGQMIGTGAAPQSPDYEERSDGPGGSVSSAKTHGRIFTLAGVMYSTTGSISDLHAQRQALYSVLDPDTVPYTEDGPQPVILRYRGATVTKQISCHYEGGFEGTLNARMCAWEGMALRFLADDPYWYQIGQTSAVLDTHEAPTLRYLAGRPKATGQWSDLGLAANPGAGGAIYAVLEASDKTVYYGGNFTGFDGNAGWDYLVKYTPSTDTWARLDGASEFNNIVLALAEAPDGTIYVGGGFTNAGDANGDYLATYTPSTDTVASVAGGGTGQVEALAFDNNGLLIIGGNFAVWNGVNESECIVSWNGAAYAAMGNGFGDAVVSIGVAPDNTVYVVGQFLTDWDGANPFVRFASWDGTEWTQVGDGLNAQALDLVVSSTGVVTVGGLFTNQDGIAEADYIVQWNGSAITAMGSGANGAVYAISIAPNDNIFASGVFTAIGGVTTRYGRWNGSSWAGVDIVLPGAPTVRDAAFGNADPVTPSNFNHWIGFSTTGASEVAGLTTVINNGTAPAYPKLVVFRSGGTSVQLISLRNEDTGKLLAFNYSLLDGETLTIDMDPQQQTVISSFFGSRFDAYLAGGDLGTWALQPGSNQITCFIDPVGGATRTAYLLWSDPFKAAD